MYTAVTLYPANKEGEKLEDYLVREYIRVLVLNWLIVLLLV